MIGRTLSRYRIIDEVGRGGMAVVYRGRDLSLDREVAVKVLHPHLAVQDESRARLEREAQAVAKLHHENILEIYDYAPPEAAERYLVTEFIHGETLTNFVQEHKIPLPEIAVMLVAEVTAALEHAHGVGVIHRDVKPENVMIRQRDGRLKLTDFGIAQIVDKERLTVTGQLLGSPAYMAPENVEGGQVGFHTDVFAAGILLYQLAVGDLPFRGRNPHEVLKKIAECRYTPPEQANPLVGARLAKIIKRALARLPEDRFPSVAEMRRELLADLADAGIDDPRVELEQFFVDPDGYARGLRGRVVAALGENGRVLATKGRNAAALALWSRALALAPGDGKVQALVDGLAGRRRSRLVAAVGAATLATGAAVAVVHFRGVPANVPVREAHARALPPPVARPVPAPTPQKTAPLPSLPRVAANGTPHAPPTNVQRATTLVAPAAQHYEGRRLTIAQAVVEQPAKPAAPSKRFVTISTFPKHVAVFVDDVPVRDYLVGQKVEVGPGAHTLRFHNPLCNDAFVVLPDGAEAAPFTQLEWRNASIVVDTHTPHATVAYDYDNRTPSFGVAGRDLRVVIPPGSVDGVVNVHLTVSADGYQQVERTVKATAGETRHETVELQPSP